MKLCRGIWRRVCPVCQSKDFFLLLAHSLLLLRSPGGLFHWNAQDLQRANKSDRPGRVDRWTEEEGDGGQAQRIACSVHCRWWLREESRKAGEGLLSCPAEWIVLYWGSFRLQLSDGQTLIVISFSLTPHQPFLNSSDARLSIYQLKCHIIKAIIQVQHWKPVFVRPCVRACIRFLSELVNGLIFLGLKMPIT